MSEETREGGMKGFFRALGAVFSDYRKGLILAAAVVIGFVLLTNGSYYFVSAKPESCLICHYMKPHYDSWLGSAHKDVGCVECHPGRRTLIDSYMLRYFTGTYHARPFPDVKPDACLKCHEETTLKGELTYHENIKFNHEHHLGQLRRGKKLRCTSCHATSQSGEHFAVDNEACFLCHFKDADRGRAFTSCNACHGVPQGKVKHQNFEFDHPDYVGPGIDCNACHTVVASGNGDVPDKKCYECHVERLENKQDVNAVHRIHISEHGVDCFKCHDRILHGKIEMTHAFELDCNKCHSPQHSPTVQLYVGTGGEGIPNVPSAMFRARVSCEACHSSSTGVIASWQEKRAACVKCHGAGFDRMLDDWKRDFDKLAAQTEAAFKRAESLAQSLPPNRMAEREELRMARINNDLLVKGRAVHNPFYSLNLSRQIIATADTIARAVGASRSSRPEMLARPDGTCRTCHNAMPFPEKIKFERMEFPHSIHSDALELPCTKCHSMEAHRERVITKTECMQCHHQEAEISCAHCHFEQEAFYKGEMPELKLHGLPDAMFKGGVGCKDCHNLADNRAPRNQVKEQCVACHDESFGVMLDKTLKEEDATLTALQVKLATAKKNYPAGIDSVAWKKKTESAELALRLLSKSKAPHNVAAFKKIAGEIETELKDPTSASVSTGKKQ